MFDCRRSRTFGFFGRKNFYFEWMNPNIVLTSPMMAKWAVADVGKSIPLYLEDSCSAHNQREEGREERSQDLYEHGDVIENVSKQPGGWKTEKQSGCSQWFTKPERLAAYLHFLASESSLLLKNKQEISRRKPKILELKPELNSTPSARRRGFFPTFQSHLQENTRHLECI